MSRDVFVDTSAWYALIVGSDSNHFSAVGRFRRVAEVERTLVTTNHIRGETYTLLRTRVGFRMAQEFLRRTSRDPLLRSVFVPEAWEEAAESLLAQYEDQDFSYVDATSFVAMRRLGIQEALAFDHHFSVAGFALLGDQ
jgi:predicted nucleic acid-binding protein